MKVLITGTGQLAQELLRGAPEQLNVVCAGRSTLDITEHDQVFSYIANLSPHVVINAAAYTAVDKAESEVDMAYAVNERGARNLAEACKMCDARMLHVSTDFVFNGEACSPYSPDYLPSPIGVYGASKNAGDLAVRELLPSSSIVVRSSWLYAATGNNFVITILRLLSERTELRVVCDQVGSPTWARSLSEWLWNRVVSDASCSGIFHWRDAGVVSWYDFAVVIQELALDKGILIHRIPIFPIPTSDYATAAARPAYSVLDSSSAEQVSGLQAQPWRQQLSLMLDEVTNLS